MAEKQTVLINDVKKGAKILTKDGQIGEIMDNKKGIRRMVKIANPNGSFDIGDEYIYKFDKVWVDDAWVSIGMTEAQEKQCASIRSFWG